MHIDPFAPGNSPYHPSNISQPTVTERTATPEEKAAAERWAALFAKHQTRSEDRDELVPDLGELEHRENLVSRWHDNGTPAAIVDLTGVPHTYGETAPGSGEYAWEEEPAKPVDLPHPNDDDLAAALAALDAIQKG